jgi:uncharacterized protein YihD (DUF1040 family)
MRKLKAREDDCMTSKQIEEVLEAIKRYWQEHQNLDFGQVLDSIMARTGDITDITRITSHNLIEYIDELLREDKVFTGEQLEKLRKNRFKEYHSNSETKSNFEKEPVPLFIDGKFVKKNYFGGDDIIRSFFTEISDSDEPIMFPETTFELNGRTYVAGLTAMKIETVHSINFLYLITGLSLKHKENHPICDVGIFGFDKNNLDNIQYAWFNGKEMEEEDYLYILNVIKSTGYNLFISQPKKLNKPIENEKTKQSPAKTNGKGKSK